MHEIAFTIFGKAIHWYGVFIALGFVSGTWLMVGLRKHARIAADGVFDLAILSLVSGLLGARLFYVIQFWTPIFSRKSFFEIFRIDKGGLVFYGGFLLAILSVWAYTRWKHLSIARVLDIAGPAIALAHAFGRIGCFLQGCCFGKPAASAACGVVYPAGSEPAKAHLSLSGESLALYPTQLYEAGLNVLLCGLLVLFLLRFQKKPGQTAGLYLTGYALIRFLLEFFRGDHNPSQFNFGLTVSQNVALFVMFPLGVALFAYFTMRRNPVPEASDAKTE